MALEKFGTGESLLNTAVETDDESLPPFTDKDIPEHLLSKDQEFYFPENVDADFSSSHFTQLAGWFNGVNKINWGSIKTDTKDILKKRLEDTASGTRDGEKLTTQDIFGENRGKAVLIQKSADQTPEVKKGLLTDFRLYGKKGDLKLPDNKTIINTLEGYSKAYKSEIEANTRGRVSDQEVEEVSELIGLSQDKLIQTIINREKGSILSVPGADVSSTIAATKKLIIEEIDKSTELARIARQGTEQDVLNFMVHMDFVADLMANFIGSKAELGRAFRELQKPFPEVTSDAMEFRDIQDALEKFGGSDKAKRIAEEFAALNNDAAKMGIIRNSKAKNFADAFYEYWINAILSSPRSQIKNNIGSFLATTAHVPETLVAGLIRKGKKTFNKDAGDGVEIGEANALIFGAYHALNDAFRFAYHNLKTGEKPVVGSKFEADSSVPIHNQSAKKGNFAFSARGFGLKDNMLGKTVDALGRILTFDRLPVRALDVGDTFFKVIAQRMSLYQQAYRSGVQNNLQGDALANHIAAEVSNPSPKVIMEADAHAQYVTLQTKLDSIGRSIQGIRQIPGVRYFLPFFRTPYNIFNYGFVERSPLGMFFSRYKQAVKAGASRTSTVEERAAADMAQSKMLLGSSAALIMTGMVVKGFCTGNGPVDPDRRRALMQTGWKPYSCKNPFNGKYYSYMGTEPFASNIGLAADFAEILLYGEDNLDDDEVMKDLGLAVAAALSFQMTNKTFMQGFSNMVGLISDPTNEAEFTATSLFKSVVPRVVADAEKAGDPILRDAQTMVEAMRSEIPFLSKGLPPRVNFWGHEVGNSGTQGIHAFVNPFATSEEGPNIFAGVTETDPKEKAKIKKFAKRAYDIDKIFVNLQYGPSKNPTHYRQGDIEIELSPEQKLKYHKLIGETLIPQLENYFKSYHFKTNFKAWENGRTISNRMNKYKFLSPETRHQAIQDLKAADRSKLVIHEKFSREIKKARDAAMMMLVTSDRELMSAIREKKKENKEIVRRNNILMRTQ